MDPTRVNEFGTSEELLAKMEREKNGEAVANGDAAAVANGDTTAVANGDTTAVADADGATETVGDKKND